MKTLVSAYILAKLEVGNEKETISKLKQIKEIKEAIITYGVFDLIIKVNFQNSEDLDDFVFNVVRQLPGVKDTMTMLVVSTAI